MKYLIAMLFYDIVIGQTVLMNREYANYRAFKGTASEFDRVFKARALKVIGIFIKKDGLARPRNIFKMGVIVQNPSGYIEWLGINAVKPADELTL